VDGDEVVGCEVELFVGGVGADGVEESGELWAGGFLVDGGEGGAENFGG